MMIFPPFRRGLHFWIFFFQNSFFKIFILNFFQIFFSKFFIQIFFPKFFFKFFFLKIVLNMKKSILLKYIAPYASSDNQLRRDPNLYYMIIQRLRPCSLLKSRLVSFKRDIFLATSFVPCHSYFATSPTDAGKISSNIVYFLFPTKSWPPALETAWSTSFDVVRLPSCFLVILLILVILLNLLTLSTSNAVNGLRFPIPIRKT